VALQAEKKNTEKLFFINHKLKTDKRIVLPLLVEFVSVIIISLLEKKTKAYTYFIIFT
jgi:hypothetical protein